MSDDTDARAYWRPPEPNPDLGNPTARLAILPGTTHYDIFFSHALASTVAPFLDAPVPEGG